MKRLIRGLIPFSTRRSLFERFGLAYYSRPALEQLDRKLEKYLPHRDGFFIELGANDGYNQSNTYYFEAMRNWHGILIEPIPELYVQAKQLRKRSQVFNCACVSFDFPDDHVEMTYSNLGSLVNGALKDNAAEITHVDTMSKMQQVTPYDLSVPVRTLTSILDECRVQTDIDLLSLDVEGFEVEVLSGLDFTRYRPRYMLIEARFKEDLDSFLARQNYAEVDQLSFWDILYEDTLSSRATSGAG
jgi:FkbM family methyltransferase